MASTSTHMDGTAIDFYIDGVDGKGLWEMIRHEACCGVGHYGGRTIHLDAGRPRFWQGVAIDVTAHRELETRYRDLASLMSTELGSDATG